LAIKLAGTEPAVEAFRCSAVFAPLRGAFCLIGGFQHI
jgi:hypothetical protein